jgi:hypothetical protein
VLKVVLPSIGRAVTVWSNGSLSVAALETGKETPQRTETHRGYIDHTDTFSGYFVQGLTSHLRPPQVSVSGTGTVAVSAVPEPGTLILVGAGALVAMGRGRRRHRPHT